MKKKYKDILNILFIRFFSFRARKFIKNFAAIKKFDEVDMIFEYTRNTKVKKIMLDVGAHTGGSCEQFLDQSWRVYAFEPDKRNRRILEVKEKKYPKLLIDTRAISLKDGEVVKFYTSNISSGISGLSKFHSSHHSDYSVETVRLETYCNERDIQDVGFMKIDTEGFDLFVLQSLDWEKIRPEIIVCEFEDNKTKNLGYNFNDLINFFKNKNYFVLISEWHPIVEYGQPHKWKKFHGHQHNITDPNAWGNIIAFKDNDLFNDFCKFKSNYLNSSKFN